MRRQVGDHGLRGRARLGAFKFTGRELDAVTGLQYHRARYYDAALGRWTQEDPIGFAAGDPNLYRYAGNAPTNFTDPDGLQATPASARSGRYWGQTIVDSAKWGWDVGGAALGGAGDGCVMVANAVTGGFVPGLDHHVNELIEEEGGAYWYANAGANVAGFALGLATGGGGGAVAGGIRGGLGAARAVVGSGGTARLVTVGGAAAGIGRAGLGAAGVAAGGVMAGNAGSNLMMSAGSKGGGSCPAPNGKNPVGSTSHIELQPADKGSYTIEFESGAAYAGKGGTTRARRSARRHSRANNDPVKSIDYTPAATDAEAFKQEAARIEAIGGPQSPGNYNKINSPGKKIP